MNHGKNHLLYQVAQRLTSNYFEAEHIFYLNAKNPFLSPM